MKFQAEYLDGHKTNIDAADLDAAYEAAARDGKIILAVWPEGMTYAEFVGAGQYLGTDDDGLATFQLPFHL